MDIAGYKCLQYRAAIPQEVQGNLRRDLYTKSDWKVDIDFLKWASDADILPDDPVPIIRDYLLHEDATARILCFDESLDLTSHSNLRTEFVSLPQSLHDPVSAGKPGTIEKVFTNAKLSSQESKKYGGTYSLIIAPKMNKGELDTVRQIRQILATGAHPVGIGTVNRWDTVLRSSGFSGFDCILPRGIIVATAVEVESTPSNDRAIVLIYRDTPGLLLS